MPMGQLALTVEKRLAKRSPPSAGSVQVIIAVPVGETPMPAVAPAIGSAAAVEVMAAHGYHGASVRDIASAAGTSAAVLYHHFASKQGLLVTICDRGLDVLVHATEEALDHAGDDPADRLGAVVEAHVRVHMESQRESLIGNSELPKVLYIVPWKKPLQGDLSGRPPGGVLDEVLAPVDRDVFRRQVRYDAMATPPVAAPAAK